MPIIVKDFTWTQNDQYLFLYVPLHGAPTSAVDLFTSEDYFKASFETFFFECFPYESIDPDESRASIQGSMIYYDLKKTSQGTWPQLEKALTKEEKKNIKAKAVIDSQEKLIKEHEAKKQVYYQMKRNAVSMAVEQDGQRRRLIEEIKEQEKLKALGNIEELRRETKSTEFKKSKVLKKHYRKIYQSVDNTKEVPSIPMPRSYNGDQNVVEVEFTPRVLPTPSRESREPEELEWLQNQAKARRSAGFDSDDLRPEEKNPNYILSKGKQFLEHKNYLGALSAFTFGVELSPKLVDWYIMRSRAHFGMGNYHKCVHDCSTAIDIMKPEVYSNLLERVECIHRRGMALFKLGLRRQAADEVKAAIKLQPSSELTRDLYEILDSPEYVEKPHESIGLTEIDH